jgi:hypothetical protein
LQYLRRPVELRRASVTLFVEYTLSLIPSPAAMYVMLPDPIPVFTSTCLVSVVSVPLMYIVCDLKDTVVFVTLRTVLATVEVLFMSMKFCGAVAPGTYDAHWDRNSPYLTVSPAFTPAVRVAGAAAAWLERRARLNGRISSVSVRRVFSCFCFTDVQPVVCMLHCFCWGIQT